VLYSEETEETIRARLLSMDGVVVWVDPLSGGKDRSRLDPLLREVAAQGVWVSAHPDVILKMGVKEVLYRTRELGWGTDTDIYTSVEDFNGRFPARLAGSGPRVLKQNRGNGGQGVWKMELISEVGPNPGPRTPVHVLHAQRGSIVEEVSLGAFMSRCQLYLAGGGPILDQAFQPRLPEGMIRCYLTQDEVVGLGHQLIKAWRHRRSTEIWRPRSWAHGHASGRRAALQGASGQDGGGVGTGDVAAARHSNGLATRALGRRLPLWAKGTGWTRHRGTDQVNLSEPFIHWPVAASLVMTAIAFVGIAAFPFLPRYRRSIFRLFRSRLRLPARVQRPWRSPLPHRSSVSSPRFPALRR
jgi:hypothetical protein